MGKEHSSEELERHYFGSDRKLHREERKRKRAKDRSKYKRSNLNKAKPEEKKSGEELLRGRVLSIHSIGIAVEVEGRSYLCSLRGALKKERGKHKNLVVVGDEVLIEAIDEEEGAIAAILPRRSLLSRADNLSRRKEQLIAANIDQVLITVSVVSPPLKATLVERYLLATKKGGMQPIIVINKVDLIKEDEEEAEFLKDFIDAYSASSIPLVAVSSLTGEGMERLKELMQGRSSVFSGQSGVGKSTLINAVTGLDLATGDVVKKTGKGAHTTTMAQLIPLKSGGYCIDTPGIKSFGVWDLEEGELKKTYSEVFAVEKNCRFLNCSHTHEEGCAVKEAVEKGEISPLRYSAYAALLEALREEHKRR